MVIALSSLPTGKQVPLFQRFMNMDAVQGKAEERSKSYACTTSSTTGFDEVMRHIHKPLTNKKAHCW